MNDRSLLMIPGPIEFEPSVMAAMAVKTPSHVSPEFIEVFGRALTNLRHVFLAPEGQPFVVAGSGTMAMEMAIANCIEPGNHVLVVGTGYFSDRMQRLVEIYGGQATQVKSALGTVPSLAEVEQALQKQTFQAMTITQVDTSTGVRAPVKELAALAKKYNALSIVDGVCSVGAETLHQQAWGVDVALTGSQKALGVPPGLGIMMCSQLAIERWKARTQAVRSMYLDWGQWLPIMKAYENRQPAYFATPPCNLILALDVSLQMLVAEGMEARFSRHQRLADAFRDALYHMNLKLVAADGYQANTLSAVYYPDSTGPALVGAMNRHGIQIAGGLHPEIKQRYFRIGHMGSIHPNDVVACLFALAQSLASVGCPVDTAGLLPRLQSKLTS
jgi:alanine-glyoxylate transaminase / serine-glyoxylate transaminase / serine-pyruvate transaminase